MKETFPWIRKVLKVKIDDIEQKSKCKIIVADFKMRLAF